MDDEQKARRERALARQNWPVRRYRLGEEPGDDLSATTTLEQRITMVWQLTQDAWASAGKPVPIYTRAETPIRIVPSPVKDRGTS